MHFVTSGRMLPLTGPGVGSVEIGGVAAVAVGTNPVALSAAMPLPEDSVKLIATLPVTFSPAICGAPLVVTDCVASTPSQNN